MSSSTRGQVLALYRAILRAARGWEGGAEEQTYIRQEAGRLFRQHQGLTAPADIQARLREGEERLQLGLHYRIPFPRLHHAAQFRRREYQDVPIIR